MGRYRTISSLNPARWVEENKVKEKSRDEQWLAVVNELKGALTKSKDTLQELNSDFGTFFYEDGSEETEQEVKDTYDHVEKTLTKAELMMKEMGQ